jgi:hypothetical protein
MKAINLAALMLCMLLSSSCLTSLQPLVTYDTVTEDNRIIGTWQSDDGVYQVEKFTLSPIYKEVVEGINVKDDAQNKKPLTEKEKKDSILYSHAYSVSWEKDGIKYYMFGSMTRINNELFLELFPIVVDDPERQDGNGLDYTFDYLATITFARVDIVNNNKVQLHFPSGDVIKEQIEKGNMRLKHEDDRRFETFLVTASTRDLRSFFEKYGHDERLFGKENSFTLTRKG